MKSLVLISLFALTLIAGPFVAEAADSAKPWQENSVKEFNVAKHYRFNLKADQDLLAAVEEFAREKGITAGYVATAVGSLKRGAARFPEHSEATIYEGTQEVVALVGTINEKGAHLHISFVNKDGKTGGGHVMPGCVINGLEVVVTELFE